MALGKMELGKLSCNRLKVLRIQPKFVAYNVSINKNFCIRSFLV